MDSKEQEEILYRLDERTERVDAHLKRLEKEVAENSKDIDDLQSSVDKNTTIIGGVGTAVTGVLIWFADKVTRII